MYMDHWLIFCNINDQSEEDEDVKEEIKVKKTNNYKAEQENINQICVQNWTR